MSRAIEVSFFDGKSARRQRALLAVQDGAWLLRGEFGSRNGRVDEVEMSEPLGGAPRTLRWPDGAACEVADHAGLAELLAELGQRPSAVVHLQSRWRWAIGAIAGLLLSVALAYFYALPWAAELVARNLPAAVGETLSEQVMATLDEHMLQPSRLPPARQRELQQRFAALLAASPAMPACRLHFRVAPKLPPNAFALPAGDIVLFDSLVELAASDEEILAVLAHEAGHVAHRHGLRQMLQSAVVSAAAAIYLGDVSSLAAGFGTLLLESNYSREFEREADRFAAAALTAAGIAPERLADMLEKLSREERKGERPAIDATLLSTHPDTAERIAALRAWSKTAH